LPTGKWYWIGLAKTVIILDTGPEYCIIKVKQFDSAKLRFTTEKQKRKTRDIQEKIKKTVNE
jgi:hypothetical protein